MKKILTFIIILAAAESLYAGELIDVFFNKDCSPASVHRWFESGATPAGVVTEIMKGVNGDEAESGFYTALPSCLVLDSANVNGEYIDINFKPVPAGTKFTIGQVEDIWVQFDKSLRYRFGLSVRLFIDSNPIEEYEIAMPDLSTDKPFIPESERIRKAPTGPLSGKTIAVRGGHGWVYNTSSSKWVTERGDNCSQYITREDFHTLDLTNILITYLEQEGAAIVHCREGNKNRGNSPYDNHPWWQMGSPAYVADQGYPASLYGNTVYSGVDYNRYTSCNLANYRGVDMYLSIHTNAYQGDCYSSCGTGIEGYWSSNHDSANSQRIAQAVLTNCNSMIRTYYDSSFACRNGCSAKDSKYSETYIPTMPSTLFEFAFHDNCIKDAKYLGDNFFRTVGMYGVAKGVFEYYGISPKWGPYSAEYVSDTIPDTVLMGETRQVSVTFKNHGLCWQSERDFKLGAVGDSDPFAASRQALTKEVMPGDTITFTFNMTFNTPGVYTTDWQMLRENDTWFGETLTKTVTVVGGDDDEAPSKPTNLRQTDFTSNSATVTWDASTDNYYVAGYKVYRNNTLVGETTGTSYTFEGLNETTSYTAGVIAVDGAGNQSEKSDKIYITVGGSFFEDGFASLDNWFMTSHSGVLTTDKNHGTLDGANSMRFDSAAGVTIMSHNFSETLSAGGYRDGGYSAWFYDPGDTGLRGGISVVLFNDKGSGKARYFLGVNAAAEYTCGVYQNNKWTYEALGARTVGWHKLELKVLSDGVDYYIDGVKAARTEAVADKSLAIRRVVLGYTGNPGATHYYDDVVCFTKRPATPSGFKALSATEDSIVWTMTDNSDNATGYNIYTSAGVAVATGYDFVNATVTETDLAPNTTVTRKAKAFTGSLLSPGFSNYGTGTTLSVAPTAENVTYTLDGGNVVFTSVGGFGAGTRSYYRYAWTESAEYTFDDSELKWQSNALTLALGTKPMYLHVKGFNSKNVANGTLVLGPFAGGEPIEIGEAKTKADGESVVLKDVTVTAVFADCYYVGDGFGGIKVSGATSAKVGDSVTVYGTLDTVDGERVIR